MSGEAIERLTSLQLGYHDKLTGVLNIRGYCDPLSRLLRHTCEGVLVFKKNLHLFSVDEAPESLIQRMLTPR